MGYLRTATLEDMALLFEWANEVEVRKNSFRTEEITWEEHQNWYQNLLQQENSRQYIYMQENEPVGQIRITVNGDEAEIGYSVSAAKRGLGYGKELLSLAQAQAKKDFPETEKLIARVKTDNIASQKAFEKTGFKSSYYVYEFVLTDAEINGGANVVIGERQNF